MLVDGRQHKPLHVHIGKATWCRLTASSISQGLSASGRRHRPTRRGVGHTLVLYSRIVHDL
ncbi:hypothetical protein EJD97_018373 [Solanum chilense]|uniref:Uncharacterized protein n=1 Tax=Solanum chilense TaxID=4083 RepID=A0A6N2C8T1_SOLCI|nr:hypothetical protein EJD97_018373 [Solanum chilense]